MTLEYFLQNKDNPAVLLPSIINCCNSFYKSEKYKQLETKHHDVNNKAKRPDKVIHVPHDNGLLAANGEPMTYQKTVPIARIVLGLQKLIVSRKTSFTTGGAVAIKSKPGNTQEQEVYDFVMKTWRDNKLQYKNAGLFKTLISETEVCEIWSSKTDGNGEVKMRMQTYSPSGGYNLYPVFDVHGDLILFGIQYDVKVDGQIVRNFKVYNDTNVIHFTDTEGIWKIESDIPHKYGKIPVIYYCVKQVAWEDAQSMIDRLEVLMSNFADTNDYNGSPIVLAKGTVEGFTAKGEQGKVLQLQGDAEVKYLSWDNAPESIKLEIENLTKLIFSTLQVPNISFDVMIGLGGLSGVAFDRVMIDAHLSAKDYQNGVYGEGIQRRLNLLKTFAGAVNLGLANSTDFEITPEFSLFSINSDEEKITTAQQANGGLPVMTHKQSIAYTGLSDDPEQTLIDIQEQTLWGL